MAVPATPDRRSGLDSRPDATTPPRPAKIRRGVAFGLLAVAMICALTIAYFLVARTDAPGRSGLDRAQALVQGDADVEDERKEVLALAQQFMLRVNTYGPADLDENNQMAAYRDRVGSIITPKFKVSFEQGVEAAEQSVAQAGVGRTSKVFGAGVSSLDVDSARVLVGGSFTVSYPNSETEGAERVEVEPSPFRVEVTVVKVDGEWLIDDFTPISGLPSEELPGAPQEGSTDPTAPAPAAPTESGPVEPEPTPGNKAPKAPTKSAPSKKGNGQ